MLLLKLYLQRILNIVSGYSESNTLHPKPNHGSIHNTKQHTMAIHQSAATVSRIYANVGLD